MRTPNLFLIGAMKSGTTTLARHLIRSADIQFYSSKEPAIFNAGDKMVATERLKAEWRAERTARYLMDATVAYTRRLDDETPRNIAAILDESPKFIYMLRNPVDRLISHYFWNRERYGESLPFSEAIARDSSYIIPSLYDSHIERYLDHFALCQFYFIKYDNFFSDVKSNYLNTLSWLDAAPTEILNLEERRASTDKEKTRVEYVPGLLSLLRANRNIIECGKRIIPAHHHVTAMRLLTKSVPREEIPAGEKQRLIDRHFADSIKRTQEMTGLDLEDWLAVT